jgi:hypothetical protein
VSIEQLRRCIPQEASKGDRSILDQILITVFVCKVLEAKFKDQQLQWDLVAKKAMVWVKKETKKMGVEIDWNAAIDPNLLGGL